MGCSDIHRYCRSGASSLKHQQQAMILGHFLQHGGHLRGNIESRSGHFSQIAGRPQLDEARTIMSLAYEALPPYPLTELGSNVYKKLLTPCLCLGNPACFLIPVQPSDPP